MNKDVYPNRSYKSHDSAAFLWDDLEVGSRAVVKGLIRQQLVN